MTFGDFTELCEKAALPLCPLIGPANNITGSAGVLPICYARSIYVANTIIFEAATGFMHIMALGMTTIMILHIRSKFTAVGRKEITTFFYFYMALTFVSLILDCGVISPTTSGVYPYIVALQDALISAVCTSLAINGFVGFQLYEDGTTLSVWLLRLTSLLFAIISFAVSLVTFKSWAGLSPTNTLGLFVVLYLINAIFIFTYLVMNVLLVTNTLQDRWPLGHIFFGTFFFVIGQVVLYLFSTAICTAIAHYLDGLFFATTCNLLAVMMVYKYWDSITKEDLEFSVGTKHNNWDLDNNDSNPNNKSNHNSSSHNPINEKGGVFAADDDATFGGSGTVRRHDSVFDTVSTEYSNSPQYQQYHHHHHHTPERRHRQSGFYGGGL